MKSLFKTKPILCALMFEIIYFKKFIKCYFFSGNQGNVVHIQIFIVKYVWNICSKQSAFMFEIFYVYQNVIK